MEQTELFIEKLENWGCDVDGAMDRFLGETELYHDCLQAVTADGALTELKTALEAGNVKNAFEAAHTLKGVLANLGVTPMYEIVVKLVEPLRSGESAGLLPYYEELQQANDYLKKLLELE